MITVLFITAMMSAGISGVAFFTASGDVPTRRDKIAGVCLGISVVSLIVVAYLAGAK